MEKLGSGGPLRTHNVSLGTSTVRRRCLWSRFRHVDLACGSSPAGTAWHLVQQEMSGVCPVKHRAWPDLLAVVEWLPAAPGWASRQLPSYTEHHCCGAQKLILPSWNWNIWSNHRDNPGRWTERPANRIGSPFICKLFLRWTRWRAVCGCLVLPGHDEGNINDIQHSTSFVGWHGSYYNLSTHLEVSRRQLACYKFTFSLHAELPCIHKPWCLILKSHLGKYSCLKLRADVCVLLCP